VARYLLDAWCPIGGAPIIQSALVLEPDELAQARLADVLQRFGYAVVTVRSTAEACEAASRTRFALTLISDQIDGGAAEPLRDLGRRPRSVGPVIVLAHGPDLERIAALSSAGADDIVDPLRPLELEKAIQKLSARLGREVSPPVEDAVTRVKAEVALWQSARMREVLKVVEQAAQIDITVMVTGETGTGKDLVARAIHHLSPRRAEPYVKVNCAAVPRELLESELFGHERGAFTGAHQLKIGKFEAAHRGTIFLDEIGDLHPDLQAKLLHVLQDGEFSRVGGKSTVRVDVRVIAATNQNLEAAVQAARFREDLYYRLNVINIEVPPLRERLADIRPLVEYFAARYSRLYKREGFEVHPRVLERLLEHNYMGNVRELENIVKRMIVLNDPLLTRASLPGQKIDGNGHGTRDADGGGNGKGEPASPPVSLKTIAREAAMAAERRTIMTVLEQTRWSRVKAAKVLNISYRALLYKIKRIGLEPKRSSYRPGV
jgi:two-component system response regulator AtoC